MSMPRQFTVWWLLSLVAACATGFALLKALPTIGILWWFPVAAVVIHRRRETQGTNRARGLWGLAALWLAWVAVLFGSLTSYVVAACLYALVARRNYRALLIFLVASPLTFASIHAVADYLRGVGTLRGRYVWPERDNIDAEFRCRHERPIHSSFAHDWLVDRYEEMLMFLIRAFGPMQGSYVGPYPEQADATLTARRGIAVPKEAIESGTIVVDGKATRLSDETAAAVRDAYETYVAKVTDAKPQPSIRPMRAALWQEQCLLLWIPVDDSPYALSPEGIGATVLIDRETGRSFAVYDNDLGVWPMTADWYP
jgi:hypothetical protein